LEICFERYLQAYKYQLVQSVLRRLPHHEHCKTLMSSEAVTILG